MDRDLEKRLAELSSQLKSGEQKEVTVDQTKVSSFDHEKIIARIHYKSSAQDEFLNAVYSSVCKVVQFPFNANYEGDNHVVVKGIMDTENIKKAKQKGHGFTLLKSFVAQKIADLKQEMKEIAKSEDSLGQIYLDDKGREYEIIDGIKTYLDDRGFDYYLKYDLDGNEYAWVKLTDGSFATFLDPERTIIMVGDKAYRFDGTIHYDEEVDFIFPHR